jgi:signal transduction histidine kinase
MNQIPPTTIVPKEQELLQILTEVSSAADVALNILNELLLYDKLEKGMLKLNKQEINVFELVQESIKMFAVQLREKSIIFEINCHLCGTHSETQNKAENVKCSSILPNDVIYADYPKIQQVLRNIFSNAIKFTPKNGQIKLSLSFIEEKNSQNDEFISNKCITQFYSWLTNSNSEDLVTTDPSSHKSNYTMNINPLSNKKVEGSLVIEITDNGAGMNAEDQKKLFNQIVQFKPEILQNGGGSGLGMWISKGIVDLHRGINVHF